MYHLAIIYFFYPEYDFLDTIYSKDVLATHKEKETQRS